MKNSIIGEGARVGSGSVIDSGSLVGAGVVLGTSAVLRGKNVSREAPEDDDAETGEGSCESLPLPIDVRELTLRFQQWEKENMSHSSGPRPRVS